VSGGGGGEPAAGRFWHSRGREGKREHDEAHGPGRGVVTALNLRPVDLDDPKSWHGCAVRSLKPVRFPVSEKAGHVQVRLPLR